MSDKVKLMTENEMLQRLDNESALELSIEKWDRIARAIKNEQVVYIQYYDGSTCALCHLYIDVKGCERCPYEKYFGHSCSLDVLHGGEFGLWDRFDEDRTYENAIAMRDALVELRD